jgi:Ca2+-binding RTX toxin-like protein
MPLPPVIPSDHHLTQTGLPVATDIPAPDMFGPVLIARPEHGHPAAASLVFTFHEPFTLGAGQLSVHSNGVWVRYELLGNPAISVVGNTLVFKPPQPLAYSTVYDVYISAGAIRDASGNPAQAGQPVGASFISGYSVAPVNAIGTDGPDTLVGGEQADILSGAAGADKLTGHEGNDLLDGGADNDELSGGGGDDVLIGGPGNDNLVDYEGNNTLRGGDGDDSLSAAGATGLLDGGEGNDALYGNDGSDYIGGAGDDRFHIYVEKAQTRMVVSGGAGADRFEFMLQPRASGQFSVTGGAGSDTYAFWGRVETLASNAQASIEDFTPGQGGDLLDLTLLLLPGLPGDPFAAGLLRLVADGQDTLVKVARGDIDAGYLSLLRLSKVRPDQLTAANFVGGLDPAGGRGLNLVGTAGNDTLRGLLMDDTLLGYGDDDALSGGAGNDRLDGGDGNDILQGDAGDDVSLGGNGDDTLSDTDSPAGSNQLAGGAGNDRLSAHSSGANLLDGGDGDDRLEAGSGTDTLLGGEGNDVLVVRSVYGDASGVISLSGGTGADTFVLDVPRKSLTITDFSAAGGDLLDVRQLIPEGWGGNPFGATAHLSLVQSGSDTLLYADADGINGSGAPVLAARLAGVTLSSLTSANLVGGFALDGSAGGQRIDGTPGADTLKGGTLDDVIRGLGGDDRIDGGASNDQIDGGAGDDTLYGEEGDDTLSGGDGEDLLIDLAGYNTLDGGPGDDEIRGAAPDLGGGGTRSVIRGGDGNDRITASNTVDAVDGGSGNDVIVVGAGASRWEQPLRLDGGEGDDILHLYGDRNPLRPVVASGGAGRDTYLYSRDTELAPLTIADFQTGANGDVVDVFSIVPYPVDPRDVNPFGAAGLVQLIQRGADTVLQRIVVEPGKWTDVIVFTGTAAASFTYDNFPTGASPDGSTQGQEISGTPGADRLDGRAFDDTLRGGGGNDRISGLAGNDMLYGDEGDDILNGGEGNDRLYGGSGADQLDDGAGNNALYGGDGDDRLASISGTGGLLAGEAGNDRINGGTGQVLDGGAGNDTIVVGDIRLSTSRTATVHGGDGDDMMRIELAGGRGFSIVADGGAGRDTYQIDGVPDSATLTILDFATGEGGDFLDLSPFTSSTGDPNPFALRYGLRIVQRGADAVLQKLGADPDPASARDIAIFAGLAASAITGSNIQGGYNPDGSSRGRDIIGTAGPDGLNGSVLDDTIRGEGGNDGLLGLQGDDQLYGGDGDDTLVGDWDMTVPSNYTIPYGHDRLDGGAGNDTLFSNWGNDVLLGGDGDDLLALSWNTDQNPARQRVEMIGGDGQDRFDVRPSRDTPVDVVMQGGAGSDTFAFSWMPSRGSLLITDFQAGAGGDILDLMAGYRPASAHSLFASGHYLLEQRGADTVVRMFTEGAYYTAVYKDFLTLLNVDSRTLTAANMINGLAPVPLPGLLWEGTESGDSWTGSALNDVARGGVGHDLLYGGGGKDLLVGGAGNDTLDGGVGIDSAQYGGARADYAIARSEFGMHVVDKRNLATAAGDGADFLKGIERALFADGAVAFDIGGNAGQAFRIYRAAFDRAPDLVGMGFWLAQMDAGTPLAAIAAGFATSKEFADLYGSAPTNADVVTRLYKNVLHRDPEPAGHAYWLKVLDSNAADLATVLAAISESVENQAAVADLIANGIQYTPYG